MKFRRWLAASAAALGIAAAVPVVAPAAPAAIQSPAVTKTCSAGFKHARINGSEKCLRRGQFCSSSAKRHYVKYGFRCVGGRLR
jgi:hypothetical protein